MRVIADLHIHSRFSRSCSKDLTLPNIAKMCERKGIGLVATADFTHPAWRKDIGEELEEIGKGVLKLKGDRSATRFVLSTEVSCIYKRGGKARRVHHVILFSSLAAVDHFNKTLIDRGFNVKSDGRPILGLDSVDLLKFVMEADEQGMLIPAHAWTPWFAIFGSQSGFDSLEECFGDLASNIYAIETGLSSDPAMNWRLSALDRIFLVSNSDAHSLEKLGREANVFEMEVPSYDELRRILVEHDTSKFIETLEFFPEEGKYHVDGHRVCDFWCEPDETKRRKGICPKCGKPLTVGVLHRVSDLADRAKGEKPAQTVPFRSVIPLAEIVADVLEVGTGSKAVQKEVDRLLADGRTEFGVLLDETEASLMKITEPEIAQAILRVRAGQVDIRPGYDGKFGKISINNSLKKKEQGSLF